MCDYFMDSNNMPSTEIIEGFYVGEIDSAALKRFSHTLFRYCRPGALTNKETENILSDLLLLFTSVVDIYFLKFSSRFLTPETYDDAIRERNLRHICGYPLCTNQPLDSNGQYIIGYANKILQYSAPYLLKYCCNDHSKASMFYRQQLSYEPVSMRTELTFFPYSKSPYESHIVILEELLDISQTNNISLTQAALLFNREVMMAIKCLEEPDIQEQVMKERDFDNIIGTLQSFSFKEHGP